VLHAAATERPTASAAGAEEGWLAVLANGCCETEGDNFALLVLLFVKVTQVVTIDVIIRFMRSSAIKRL